MDALVRVTWKKYIKLQELRRGRGESHDLLDDNTLIFWCLCLLCILARPHELSFDLQPIHCDRWLQVSCRASYSSLQRFRLSTVARTLVQRIIDKNRLYCIRNMSSISSPPESLLKPINVPQKTLLGPGPSSAPPRVLAAGSLPLLGHLHSEFVQVNNSNVFPIPMHVKFDFYRPYSRMSYANI